LLSYSTTDLFAPFAGRHAAPQSDLVVIDGVLEAVDPHRAAVAVRLALDDQAFDAFLEEQVARRSAAPGELEP